MRDNDEVLGFFDRDGADAEKYRAIDNLLKLSERFSKASMKRKKRIYFMIGAALMLLGIVLWIATGKYNVVWAFLIIFGFIQMALGLIMKNMGLPAELDMAESIIAGDGIDAVYEDMLSARCIKDTDLMAGSRYLFGEGNMVVRLRDIIRVYRYTVGGGAHSGGASHYAALDIVSDSGIVMIEIEKLNRYGFGQSKRLAYLQDQIMAAKMFAERD